MRTGVIRLFRFAGIDVYLHFSWFLVAAIFMTDYIRRYESPVWGVLEYLSVFVIVLVHEFGHALACRQVGGIANRIVLWPLGGIAFVSPPRRPGAYLWSIAAGPLVNVALVPVFEVLWNFAQHAGWAYEAPDTIRLVWTIRAINYGLLIFNMLPVYPLDGGQILRALLWFPLGEIRSLQIASVIGLIGGACLAAFAIFSWSFWIGIMAFFLLTRAIACCQYAKALTQEKEAISAAPPPPVPP